MSRLRPCRVHAGHHPAPRRAMPSDGARDVLRACETEYTAPCSTEREDMQTHDMEFDGMEVVNWK